MLCQWWYAPFSLAGKSYHTAEHYMMAQKARLFGDTQMEQRILDSKDPSEAQYLGRKVAGYRDDVWASARFTSSAIFNLSRNTSTMTSVLAAV